MKINNLPNEIAVFPLSNAVFFPRTILPLNIFEERYVQLINDCMKGDRLFGMVQPKLKKKNTEVYSIGCLGKIISFNEVADKRFIISLSGLTLLDKKSSRLRRGTSENHLASFAHLFPLFDHFPCHAI